MTRKDFLKNLTTLGVAAPFLTMLSSCGKEDISISDFEVNFSGKVIIIGAGAAGLTAGYILNSHGIDFEIIEASSVFGGRVKKLQSFADFPIDLGGEWIHTDPSVLAKLVNDSKVDANIDIVTYNPQTVYLWKNNKLRKRNFFSNFYSEYKFKNTTWYDFFDQYIVPDISDRIRYNKPVNEINYTAEKVMVTTSDSTVYEADKVLVTVPVSILKSNAIDFQPALPSEKIEALDSIDIPPILKVFVEFSERFYPDVILLGGLSADDLYYDAAFGKDSDKNILGLFSIGDRAGLYSDFESEDDIIEAMLKDLDEMFDGKASATYQKHVIQNWTKEPYIQGSYSHFQNSTTSTIETLIEPLDNKIYFAGEACNLNGDTSTVHGAGESAYLMVERILK